MYSLEYDLHSLAWTEELRQHFFLDFELVNSRVAVSVCCLEQVFLRVDERLKD